MDRYTTSAASAPTRNWSQSVPFADLACRSWTSCMPSLAGESHGTELDGAMNFHDQVRMRYWSPACHTSLMKGAEMSPLGSSQGIDATLGGGYRSPDTSKLSDTRLLCRSVLPPSGQHGLMNPTKSRKQWQFLGAPGGS
jgi:hypothetical protein